MAAQALYLKWRPRSFDEVVGQEHVVRTLRNALTSGRIHHAYLFAGPRGTGKTTTARLLAKAVNCLAPEEQRPCNECEICRAINEGRLLDLIEIDAASNTGVDDVRELRERVGFRPNEARYKVYVVDEVHMLSNAAFNALLKTLEEPPAHAIFVLATTEPQKIPATVLSRCQRFEFHRIPVDKIVARLEQLAEREGIQVEPQALTLIARQATGSMRDAESLLDQIASYNVEGITVEEVHAVLGTGTSETVSDVTGALIEGDVARGLGAINEAVDGGADPRQLARQIVEHLRALLLLRLETGILPPRIPDDLRPQLEQQAAAFPRRELVQAVRLFNQAADEAKGGWQPQLPLEIAFVEAMLSSESEGRSRSRSSSAGGAREPRSSRRSKSSTASAKPESAPSRSAQARSTSSPAPSSSPSEAGEVRESGAVYEDAANGAPALTLEALQRCWTDVLNALRPHDLSLEALMRSCQPVAVEGEEVVLGFTHKFHRGKVEEEKKRSLVEDALSDVFGQRVHVRCVMADQRQSEETQEREAAEEDLVKEDPVVRTAVDELGAQIVRH